MRLIETSLVTEFFVVGHLLLDVTAGERTGVWHSRYIGPGSTPHRGLPMGEIHHGQPSHQTLEEVDYQGIK